MCDTSPKKRVKKSYPAISGFNEAAIDYETSESE